MSSCLNAPYGAPCFLTQQTDWEMAFSLCLNAPYGAPCFLTHPPSVPMASPTHRLNALYGAPCFLTSKMAHTYKTDPWVLIHLMVLRAF